jgi:hypothetical protein
MWCAEEVKGAAGLGWVGAKAMDDALGLVVVEAERVSAWTR